MRLPKEYVDEMIAHAIEDVPNECCGIVAGKDGTATKLFRGVNSEASPWRFVIGNLAKINAECNANNWEFFVIYHSHTASEAYPSPTDVRRAKMGDTDLLAYPDTYYVVISLSDRNNPVVRAFLIGAQTITEEPIETE